MAIRDRLFTSMARVHPLMLFFGLLALLLAHGMALLFRVQPAVSLWFPPSGVAIALSLWLGPSGAALTALVSVWMAPLWGSDGWFQWLGLLDAIEPLVAWGLYRVCFRGSLSLKTVRDAITFLLSAPLVACGASAVIGSSVLALCGKLSLTNLNEVMAHWWLGNAIGTVAIAPALLLVFSPFLLEQGWVVSEEDRESRPTLVQLPTSRNAWIETGILLVILLGTAWVTVQQTQERVFTFQQLSLLSFIPTAWAATRFGVRGGILTASFSVFVTLLNYIWLYPHAFELERFPVSSEILHIHKLSLLIQCAVGLLVGTAMTERSASQVALAVERTRLVEYEARAQLSDKLFRLNCLLADSNQQLAESENRFRRLIENSPDVISRFDQTLRHSFVSPQIELLTGISPNDFLGKTVSETGLPAENAAIWESALKTAFQEGKPQIFEFVSNAPNGETRFYQTRLAPELSPYSGAICSVLAVTRDITDLKQAEAQLQERQRFIQQIADTVPEILYVYDLLEQRNVYVNHQIAVSLDYAPEEIQAMGENFFPQLMHPDDLKQIPKQMEKISHLQDREILEFEFRMQNSHGEWRWFSDRSIVMSRTPDGTPRQILGCSQDVTARKQAEQKLQQAHERFRLAASAVNGMIYDFDLVRQSVERTEGLLRVVGYTPQEVPPTPQWWWEQVHPEDQQQLPKSIREMFVVNDRATYEYRVRHRDGHYVYVMDQSILLYDAEGNPNRMVGSTTDISDRKYAEDALRQSEARYRYLAESIPQLVWMSDAQGNNEYVNQQLCDYTGFSPGEFRTSGGWETAHPDELPLLQEKWATALQQGMTFEHECRLEGKDKLYRWFLVRAIPLRDRQGQIVKWFGTNTDIQQQKELEEERTCLLVREQAARQQAELASRTKDEFLAIVSHELRSPLNGILGWSRLLRTRKLDPTTTERALSSIERNAEAQTQLIEDLLDISRIIRGTVRLNLRPVNLNSVVQAAIDTVRPTAEIKSIQVGCWVDPTLGLVSGDAERLQQVIWNLLSNAVKFTPEGGQVEVRVEKIQRSNSENLCLPAFPVPHRTSHDARIQVTDTGKGISPEFLPYVFDRFRQADSTTTRGHGGLGLGLAIVRSLVELHGGTVQVESQGEGQGSTFSVELPCISSVHPSPDQGDRPSLSLTHSDSLTGLKVLVVDDEADTRDFLVTVLEQFGATPIAADSVQDALAKFLHHRPDILLSDIGMPGEDGYTLIRRIRSLPSELGCRTPAAALTAYVRSDDRLQALEAGFQLHVPKPIEPLRLLRAIAQLAELATDSKTDETDRSTPYRS
ncbi:MAG: PAS domain S-box protein [Leptolyngbyaceae cyanobacterium bins.59]|nr:PAS domain S-box protein [Leptolyngbyaceae cyanobacterium bins.59]